MLSLAHTAKDAESSSAWQGPVIAGSTRNLIPKARFWLSSEWQLVVDAESSSAWQGYVIADSTRNLALSNKILNQVQHDKALSLRAGPAISFLKLGSDFRQNDS